MLARTTTAAAGAAAKLGAAASAGSAAASPLASALRPIATTAASRAGAPSLFSARALPAVSASLSRPVSVAALASSASTASAAGAATTGAAVATAPSRGVALGRMGASTAEELRAMRNANLMKYCVDLTAMAREHKLDPVIGREDELRRIIEVLSRRRKNSVAILGEPGTGYVFLSY